MVRKTYPRELVNYQTTDGQEPFSEWFYSLRDKQTQRRVSARLLRVEEGNLGDHASVGDDVWELRLFFGAGYRIYYAEEGDRIILLLSGGDKSSQSRDIERAKVYWKEYQER